MSKKLIASLLSLVVLALPVLVLAQNFGLENVQIGLGNKPLMDTVNTVIKTLLSFLGIVAVVIILYGGFVWMTAAGNEEKVGTAKQILGAGIIGLVIIILAYAIATFVIGTLRNAA